MTRVLSDQIANRRNQIQLHEHSYSIKGEAEDQIIPYTLGKIHLNEICTTVFRVAGRSGLNGQV